MKEEEKQTENYIKVFLSVALLVIIMFVYNRIIEKDVVILEIIVLSLAAMICLFNFYYIFQNKKITKVSRRLIHKKEVSYSTVSPLETTVLSSIWYHKKIVMSEREIMAELCYEIEKGNLLPDKNTLRISSNLPLESLTEVQQYVYEIVFLDSISIKQLPILKKEKLKKIQEEGFVLLLDVEKNIRENLKDKSKTYDFIGTIKRKYFKELEKTNSAFLTIISMLLILLNIVEAMSFCSSPSIFNFYLPLVAAFLLVVALTDKNREGLTLLEEKKEEVSTILNYVRYVSSSKENKIYLCSLGLLSKEETLKITQIFHVE